MPTKSSAQYRLMQGIKHGTIPEKDGLTKQVAAEFISATPKKKREQFAKVPYKRGKD